MKRSLIVLFVVFLSLGNLFSQERDSILASKHRPGFFSFFTGAVLPYKPWIPRHDRLMIDIKYGDLINTADKKFFRDRWSSIGVNLQMMGDLPIDNKGIVSFGFGIGYGFGKFDHNQDIEYVDVNKFEFTGPTYAERAILRTHTFYVPIEFRFRTPGKNYFNFHIGSSIGYRFGNNSTYFQDVRIRKHTKDIQNFENIHVDAHLRIGYKGWMFFTSVDLLPILRNTSVPYYPVSLGLTISLF